MVKIIRYPLPKEVVEVIEKRRIKMAKEFNVRNIPKTKFFKRYVKLSFNIPNEIKKIRK